MKKLLAVLGLAVLTGCAATNPLNMTAMQSHGNLSLDPSDNPAYDYRLKVTGAWDVDTFNPDTRMKLAHKMLDHQCRELRKVGEDTVDRGKSAFGVQQITYYLKLKCIK